MARRTYDASLYFSDDPEVQKFFEQEFWKISPYTQPEAVMSAWQLFQAARARYGDRRLLDLVIWQH